MPSNAKKKTTTKTAAPKKAAAAAKPRTPRVASVGGVAVIEPPAASPLELMPGSDVANDRVEQPLHFDNVRPATLPIDLPQLLPPFPEAVNDNLAVNTWAELSAAMPRTKREWALFVGGGILVAGFIVGFLWAFPAACAALGLN